MLQHTQSLGTSLSPSPAARPINRPAFCRPPGRQPFSSGATPSTSTTSSSITNSSSCCRSRVSLAAAGRDRSGPSGLNVAGHSPTSPSGWDAMRQALQDAGVKLVSPQELVFAAERDTVVIVDVRPEADYEEGHIPDALSVPFYRPITGWEPFKIARRLGYAAFGVLKGTEVNPDFAKEVRQIIESAGPDKTLVLYCSQGGMLESTETHRRGWQTRSLVAAYDITQDGLSNVQVLRDGYTGWINAGRDIEVLEYADEGAEELAA